MLTEKEILENLDNSNKQGYYCSFIELGHAYSYLIDCRLNVFRGDNDRWAVAAERLGYNPRRGGILLDIYYFGNCLINLEHYNGQDTNWYSVMPVDNDSFWDTINGECLKPDAEYWMVRGQKVKLSHNKQDYFEADIELKEYEPNEISAEEVGRLVVLKHRELFRATGEELYKSIPGDLKKILVLDEWYHRDYIEVVQPKISDEHLRYTYEFNKNLASGQEYMDYESFAALFRQGEQRNNEFNQQQWQDNRPSSYETWQQIARVIVTGDLSHYKPTLEPNTHWKYWPDSGTL
ncbi:hypothetical protein OCK74_10665 [Chitinophagaceae bacterium LB-8]|uniref:Uncharacterized protein n=1 Tax=Paraflavisolibacter caeni TaxID=2982496 RepID=A0A9X3BFT0_9BACT|nr:hypothetical protein [Paraflavisolibacter caeni]MCU7549579.1 hypothetical protein [Paraflavisolibacter caeni]